MTNNNESKPFEEVFEPMQDFADALRDELSKGRPPRYKSAARELTKQLISMEAALAARDNYADKQQAKIDELMDKVDQYERFFHAVQLNYQVLKDHRAVQELIDRACQWSLAYRNYHGELHQLDRSVALEMATRRLRGDP